MIKDKNQGSNNDLLHLTSKLGKNSVFLNIPSPNSYDAEKDQKAVENKIRS